MYVIYLKDEDLLTAEHFPAAALINEAANSDIVEFVLNLVQGIGSGYDYSNCVLWNDLDEYDQTQVQKFDGIWVTNEGGDSVIMSYKEFLYYLEKVFSRITNLDNEGLSKLQQLLSSFKEKYC